MAMNRVILMGRLTTDPDLRQTPQGTSVTRFTIAVDRRIRKEGGQQADFITCVAWRQTAEFICRFFGKGRMIAIEGQLQSHTWEGKDGRREYSTEVLVDNAFFTSSKNESGAVQGVSAPATSQDNFTDMTYEGDEFADLHDDDVPF